MWYLSQKGMAKTATWYYFERSKAITLLNLVSPGITLMKINMIIIKGSEMLL